MSTRDLETELASEREGSDDAPSSNATPITVEEALAYRNAGNLPDDLGRSLRLVLRVGASEDLDERQSKRLIYEPDYLEAPSWRRPGSVPVNVVPLRMPGTRQEESGPWWDEPSLARLEAEWDATGKVAGVTVPAAYRGFVYKTILELQAAGRAVTVAAIADSIARWTRRAEADEIRRALEQVNAKGTNA